MPVRVVKWGYGVTVSGELACPAALHPRCGVVDIFPRFLFKSGFFTLMKIASLMVLMNPCDSLPTMEKLSNVMSFPVVWKCSEIGEGALRCPLYLSLKLLSVSPMYSMLQLG